MKKNRVGNSAVNISDISLGALHFGVYLDQKESFDLLAFAVDMGINFIDTGPLYGGGVSEEIVGKFIQSQRNSIVISTKVGLNKEIRSDGTFGVGVKKLTRQNITNGLNESLSKLQTDYIDILQLHAYDPDTTLVESIEILEELVKDGKIRTYGVSNYNPQQFIDLINTLDENDYKNFSCIESHYNLIERMIETALLPLVEKSKISLIPYRSLARGVLSGKYLGGLIPDKSRAEDSWRVRNSLTAEVNFLVKSLSEEVAKKYGKTILELSIAWLLRKKSVPTVLIGCRNIKQLSQCIDASNWMLTNEALQDIEILIDRLGCRDHVQNSPRVYFEQ
jgi:aryl-alcohol dehydrogenase-like predicted oxidoreductase